MCYTITIGEKTIKSRFVWAEPKILTNAPAFNEITDYTNSRSPSYSGWDNFLNFVGSEFSALIKEELMPNHPGWKPLKAEHHRKFNKIFQQFKCRYPHAKATFESGKEEDGALCRLIWLDYWMKWALKNCKEPIFYNS